MVMSNQRIWYGWCNFVKRLRTIEGRDVYMKCMRIGQIHRRPGAPRSFHAESRSMHILCCLLSRQGLQNVERSPMEYEVKSDVAICTQSHEHYIQPMT